MDGIAFWGCWEALYFIVGTTRRNAMTKLKKSDLAMIRVYAALNRYMKALEARGQKLKCYRFDVRPDGSTFAQAEFYPKPVKLTRAQINKVRREIVKTMAKRNANDVLYGDRNYSTHKDNCAKTE